LHSIYNLVINIKSKYIRLYRNQTEIVLNIIVKSNTTKMNKMVFRFWIINVLISILLFIGYRVIISLTPTIEGNSFEKWMQI